MEVSQFCLIFPNVLQKLKHLRKHLFNNIFVQKPVFTTVPKLKLRIVFPYLGNVSSITKKILSRCISKRLKFCKLKIIFQSVNILKIYFRFKIVFLKPCNLTLSNGLSAEAEQLPITYKDMKGRVSEHQVVSPRTGKRVKGALPTIVMDHLLHCDREVAWEYIFLFNWQRVKPLLIGKIRKLFHYTRQLLLKQENILSGAIFIQFYFF